MKLIHKWDRFWFEPTETLTIGVIRALCGFLLLSWCILLSGHVGEWFTNTGLVTATTAQAFDGQPYHFSLLFFWPGNAGVYTVFAALLVSSLFVMLGLFTRWSSLCAYLCLLSFHHRNLVILNSGDTLLKLMLFYICLAPADVSFSLDSLLRRRARGPERPSLLSGFLNGVEFTPAGPRAAPWAQRLLQCQLSMVYISTFLWKSGPAWHDGTALWYVFNLSEMVRFPMPELLHTTLYINLATWGALVAELSMGILVWFRPTRIFALVLGVLLHLGIEYSMNVPLFSAIIVSCYLSFLNMSALWERFVQTTWGQKLMHWRDTHLPRLSWAAPGAADGLNSNGNGGKPAGHRLSGRR